MIALWRANLPFANFSREIQFSMLGSTAFLITKISIYEWTVHAYYFFIKLPIYLRFFDIYVITRFSFAVAPAEYIIIMCIKGSSPSRFTYSRISACIGFTILLRHIYRDIYTNTKRAISIVMASFSNSQKVSALRKATSALGSKRVAKAFVLGRYVAMGRRLQSCQSSIT